MSITHSLLLCCFEIESGCKEVQWWVKSGYSSEGAWAHVSAHQWNLHTQLENNTY